MADAPSDEDLDALYGAPFAEFVARRNALAKELKTAGEGAAAEAIRRLAKPALSAWAVNRLALAHAADFAELLAAGDAVRDAQRSGDAASLRAATEERKQIVARLLELAAAEAAAQGSAASDSIVRRIRSTLEALAAWGSAHASEPPPGRLDGDVEPPGFEVLMGQLPQGGPRRVAAAGKARPEAPARLRRAPAREPAGRTAGGEDGAKVTDAQRGAARRAVEQARKEVDEAASQRARAGREEGALRRQIERLARTVRLAEERLERERAKLAEANDELARVRSAIERSRFAEAQARASLERAQAELRDLG